MFVVVGLAVGAFGAFNVTIRGGGTVGRGLVAAALFSALGLAVGVLYSNGVPLIHPTHAPTAGRVRLARVVRWPLALGWAAQVILLVATG